jgi:hypothetical protein
MVIGVFPGRMLQAQDVTVADEVPRIAQTPQMPGAPTVREPAGGLALPESTFAAPMVGGAPPISAAPGAGLEPAFGGTQFAALGGTGAATPLNEQIGGLGGYIDNAIPRNRLRLRYDAGYGDNEPDRAEYFYPQCGCFLLSALPSLPSTIPGKTLGNVGLTPTVLSAVAHGFGPPKPEKNVDFQELSTYLEFAPLVNFSAFIDQPVRWINPQVNRNAYGFGDMRLGFKYAFLFDPNYFYTFQFKVYVPTGSTDLGLGTGHASLEPGLLVFHRLTDRLYFIGEFVDWIPIEGTKFVGSAVNGLGRGRSFAGNILNYGAGLFYNAVLTDNFRIAPTVEFVGWTVLGGLEATNTQVGFRSAAGDTIVNGKFGVRLALGNYQRAGGGSALNDRFDWFIGYARALTDDVWYRNMFRTEVTWFY